MYSGGVPKNNIKQTDIIDIIDIKTKAYTFINIMFSICLYTPGFCKSHINLTKRVFPHPVSPIIMTGMSHLKTVNGY